METIILKCRCQTYLGVHVFHKTLASIKGHEKYGYKVELVELNLSEDEYIHFFVLKVIYKNPLELCIIASYIAEEFEDSQVREHGDKGGFWILNEDLLPFTCLTFAVLVVVLVGKGLGFEVFVLVGGWALPCAAKAASFAFASITSLFSKSLVYFLKGSRATSKAIRSKAI